MNINLTLIGQTITFIVFVWFCMKYIWPPIMDMLEARKTRIADGLAAAEQGKREREQARRHADQVLGEARGKAAEIVAGAERRGTEIVETAKNEARNEGKRLVSAAHADVEREAHQAREALRAEVAVLAAEGAARILGREIDPAAHDKMLKDLAGQL